MKLVKFSKLCILFSGMILCQTNSNSYSNLPEIKPPSIDSYNLGKYGNIPVGMFTGSPNVQIPLTSLTLDGYEVPISLSYTSNGIRVDEQNGNIGLGWVFNAGGIISKIVRDLDDELSERLNVPNIDVVGINNVKEFLYHSQNDGKDSESDLYLANINGKSFKYIFDVNGNALLYSKENYKIFPGYIIDKSGIKYFFCAAGNYKNKDRKFWSAGI